MPSLQLLVADPARRMVSRRQLFHQSVAVGASLMGSRISSPSSKYVAQPDQNLVRWISPRGTLEVLDDFPYWVAVDKGYFEEEGIEPSMNPGDPNAGAPIVSLMDGLSDVAYPWPGAVASALSQNLSVISVWQMCAFDPFAFAFPKGGATDLKGLEGKRIAIAHENWQTIGIPEVAQNGDVDPSSVQFISAGETWADAVVNGQADTALVWEGLRARWTASGLDYDYLMGRDFSRFPGNSFVIRRSDYEDPDLRDLYVRYLRAWAKGLEFTRTDVRNVTQIVWERFPTLRQVYGNATVAAEAVAQLTRVFVGGSADYWGLHDYGAWEFFLNVFEQFVDAVPYVWLEGDPFSIGPLLALAETESESAPSGQVPNADNVYTNELAEAANEFDRASVQADAESFELSPEFEEIPFIDI